MGDRRAYFPIRALRGRDMENASSEKTPRWAGDGESARPTLRPYVSKEACRARLQSREGDSRRKRFGCSLGATLRELYACDPALLFCDDKAYG